MQLWADVGIGPYENMVVFSQQFLEGKVARRSRDAARRRRLLVRR